MSLTSSCYGTFDDAGQSYCITDPLPPRPWINYLGNSRLAAFISQNAGGLLWHKEPQSRRISRYHYIPAPPDRPGFYLYIRDRKTGTVWNPHFAPTCTALDSFLCRHQPGATTFVAEKDGARVEICYTIPPHDDVMLWQVRVSNTGSLPLDLQLASYLEFGLLEFMRETIGWCYLKHHFALHYDAALRAIRYDYHVFEAPFTPCMLFASTAPVAGYDASRDAFIGRTGSLQSPAALCPGHELSNSELPLGGHGAGVLGTDVKVLPGESTEFCYLFALGDTWNDTDALVTKYSSAAAVNQGIAAALDRWQHRFATMQAQTGDVDVDRFVNIWNPYNACTALELTSIISTDHMGLDGLRYRDTTQYALAVAHLDADLSAERMHQVFSQQTQDGGGCYSFYPFNPTATTDSPHRSDNTVWQIYTMKALLAETGDWTLLDAIVPFRDGGEATVYEHLLRGLQHIEQRRGPHGLPTLFHADWNDGLALFGDEAAESVMLGMQLVHSCREMSDVAFRLGRDYDAEWCAQLANELSAICNSDRVWDGAWYRRLLMSNGKCLGSSQNRQGTIFLNPQSWSVIAGIGDFQHRGKLAMDAVAAMLDTPCGLRLLAPPFTGIPEPEDPPLGSSPGTGENGAIFCHANCWAIIAEALLGNAERAYKYYHQILPTSVIATVGIDRYEREPYAYVSSIVSPASDRFGNGGISWLTGTASWMYIAATQYLLGIRPTIDGLFLKPCLPVSLPRVHVQRRYRDGIYEIDIDNAGRETSTVELNGKALEGSLLPCGSGINYVTYRC